MSLIWVDREQLEATLGPAEARAAIGCALRAGPRRQVARTSVPFGQGELLVMPADEAELAGVKVLALPKPADAPRAGSRAGNGANREASRAGGGEAGGGAGGERPGSGAFSGAAGGGPPRPPAQGLYVLFDARSLAPLAAFDAGALTELRTAAVSAWVVGTLAPSEATTLALFGTGAQARAHLAALAAVRSLEQVLVLARQGTGASRLIAMAERLGLVARPASPAEVAQAGIVCCCTSSGVPLFDGRDLRPGTLVIAIGSYHPDRREVDSTCVRRSQVVVEDRAAALAEAGDLVLAMGEGAFSPTDVAADLFELAQGARPAQPGRDLTLFKSVGAAFEDLAVARALWERLAGARPPGPAPPASRG